MENVDVRERHRAADRAGTVGTGVRPHGFPLLEHPGDLVVDADAAAGEVARRDHPGELGDIRLHSPVLEPKALSGATGGGNHLLGDEKHLILVADLAAARKLVIGRYGDATRALNRLRQEHGHVLGTLPQNGLLQFVGSGDSLAGARGRRVTIGSG